MDLELLRTFLEVNRVRHFGRAAEALHITQAAVSARIKHLETIVGVQLFNRDRRDIRLTPEGNRLVRYAEALIADWRKARQDVAMGAATQQLTVGGNPRLWDILLQEWLHQVRHAHPKMGILAESHSPEILTRRLLDGILDVAFMLEPAQLEVLRIIPVADVTLHLVSTNLTATLDSVFGPDYVMVDWGLAFALEHRREFPDAPEPHTRLAQARMALAYLHEFGGAAYLPLRMVDVELAEGHLFTVSAAPVIGRTAYAVYPVRTTKTGLIKEVLGHFKAI